MARNISDLAEVLLGRGKFTKIEAIASVVASIVFSLVFCYPLVSHLWILCTPADWDLIAASQWAAYRTVREFHQFPLWNPFECGGLPLLGDPQSHFMTPWFILTLIFGPVLGLRIEVLIYSAIAWSGGYVLGRVVGLRRISAICTATTFAGSSWFFLHAAEGHILLLTFVYLPWIIAAGWSASERGQLRYGALCGALIAVSYFEGNPLPPLYGSLTLALVLFGRAAMRMSARPLIALVVASVFAAGLGAVKVLPAMKTIASHPRSTDAGYSNSVDTLREALLSRNQDHDRPAPDRWGFWEFGAYVGLFAVIAMAALISPRNAIPWILTAIILFHLARGWTGENSLYVWLHTMPLFSSTRLPSRFLIPFVLMVAVLAGMGIDAMCSGGSRGALAVCAVLVLIGGVDLFLVGPPNLRYVLLPEVPPRQSHPDFSQYLRSHELAQSAVIRDSQGVVNCYAYTDWPTEAKGENEPGYRGEQYLLGPGTVTLVRWTPNRLEYNVDADAPSIMVVNQNYDPSWRVISGLGRTFSQDGLLAVRVPAGKSEVDLRYVSLIAIYGFAITLLTAVCAIVLFRKARGSAAASE
jgi:hypothetical protein